MEEPVVEDSYSDRLRVVVYVVGPILATASD